MPEHILSKPGPLTQEEFQKIRIHPQVGAEIIAAVPFPYPVAPLIMSHHERWDGKGYPQGLAGADIPLGARILTIVDYYDAVTTERPYHKALSYDSAIGLLKHEAGRALDPKLVPMFIEMLPSLIAELGPRRAGERAGANRRRRSPGSTAVGLVPAPSGNAFENIALAHREIYALYEIAQSMGTSLGVAGHDGADLVEALEDRLVVGLRAVPLPAGQRFAEVPVRGRRRRAEAAERDDEDGAWLVGLGRAQPPHADQRQPARSASTPRRSPATSRSTRRSSARCSTTTRSSAAWRCTTSRPNHYTEDHRRLLERIAEQAGAVIHNSIVFEQTQEDSLTDPLTGLPNRRSMFVHLSRELARAERLKSEVAIIVMDIDGFKAINDTCGHNVGDHALREVANALQGALRPYDLCVRYAGDEFIVVLTDCSRETAEAKRRELQATIAEIQVDVRAGKRLRLGVSAGAAVFPHDGTTYEELLADADHLMYRDKAARRGHGTVPAHRGSQRVHVDRPVRRGRSGRPDRPAAADARRRISDVQISEFRFESV